MFELAGVSKTYGASTALHETDLNIPEGRSVGIIGESGSGKTTLVRLMLGLTRPSTGTVRFRGDEVDPDARGATPVRKAASLVLQDPYSSLNPRMTVGRIVAEPLQLLGYEGDRRARVAEVLDRVGLDPAWSSRYPHQLSGGQRQRVAIARAIASRPAVLVADEPVSALDVTIRSHILDLLADLASTQGLSLILVSHDLGIVERMCEDTVVLASGRVIEAGQTRDVLSAPTHPITADLIRAVPRLPEER